VSQQSDALLGAVLDAAAAAAAGGATAGEEEAAATAAQLTVRLEFTTFQTAPVRSIRPCTTSDLSRGG
jgi:hypothetical protein